MSDTETTENNSATSALGALTSGDSQEKIQQALDVGKAVLRTHGADKVLIGAGAVALLAGLTIYVSKPSGSSDI